GPWRRIVGVVASIKSGNVGAASDRYVYAPHAQLPAARMDAVIRSAGPPQALASALRQSVSDLDPDLPVYDVHLLTAAVERSLSPRRVVNGVLAAFALLALALAAVGTYGVMALEVAERTNEFGIRLALGATPGDVVAAVLRQGTRLVVVGIALGLASAGLLARALQSLLFDVPPIDVVTFAGVALALAAVALASCAVPARRATGVDPLTALRVP